MSTVQGLNKTKKSKADGNSEDSTSSLCWRRNLALCLLLAQQQQQQKVARSSVSSPVHCSAVVDRSQMIVRCHIPLLAGNRTLIHCIKFNIQISQELQMSSHVHSNLNFGYFWKYLSNLLKVDTGVLKGKNRAGAGSDLRSALIGSLYSFSSTRFLVLSNY